MRHFGDQKLATGDTVVGMMKLKVAGHRTGRHLIFTLVVMLLGVVVCNASPITYNINRTIGVGSVTGFIETDGTLGGLTSANLVDWSLVLNDGTNTFNLYGPLSGNNSVVYTLGSDVSASTTQLLSNFSGTDNGLLLFQQGLFMGNHYYCAATQLGDCLGPGETVAPIGFAGHQFVIQSGNVVIGTAGSPVPESGTLIMFGSGVVGLAGILRRRISLL